MNWLAHTLLSKKDIDYQLGNVLADPMRGIPWKGASSALVQGMKMHKAIDKFTDKHELVAHSKSLLGGDGHLKGVVLDVLYDHFLSQNWCTYCRYELREYLSRFNQRASKISSNYPDKARIIVSKMVATNLLGKYQSFEGFSEALQRIDIRLSERTKAKESASQYIDVVAQQYEQLKSKFEQFFPALIKHFKNHKLGSADHHFLN